MAEGNYRYVSSWEKSPSSAIDIKLSGDEFELEMLEVSPRFFAHRATKVEDFELLVENVFRLLTCEEINKTGHLNIFWNLVNDVACALLKIHPDWETAVDKRLRYFDRHVVVPFTLEKMRQIERERRRLDSGVEDMF